jgi:hypothetical protein
MLYAFFISGYMWNICECWYVPYARYDTWYMIYICGYIVMLSALKWPLHCFLLFVFGRSVARWTLRGPFEMFLTGGWLGAADGRRLSLTSRIRVPPSSVYSFSVCTHTWWGVGRYRKHISLCGHPVWDRRRYTGLRGRGGRFGVATRVLKTSRLL